MHSTAKAVFTALTALQHLADMIKRNQRRYNRRTVILRSVEKMVSWTSSRDPEERYTGKSSPAIPCNARVSKRSVCAKSSVYIVKDKGRKGERLNEGVEGRPGVPLGLVANVSCNKPTANAQFPSSAANGAFRVLCRGRIVLTQTKARSMTHPVITVPQEKNQSGA